MSRYMRAAVLWALPPLWSLHLPKLPTATHGATCAQICCQDVKALVIGGCFINIRGFEAARGTFRFRHAE